MRVLLLNARAGEAGVTTSKLATLYGFQPKLFRSGQSDGHECNSVSVLAPMIFHVTVQFRSGVIDALNCDLDSLVHEDRLNV
jgi:hypothetical protein